MKMIRVFKIGAALLALAFFAACGGSPPSAPLSADYSPPVPMAFSPVTPLSSITVSGVVESDESRNVYTTLGFMIDSVYVEVGDIVREGQVLATMDTADLVLSIAQQRAALDQARQNSQNAIRESRRMLNEASTNLANNTNMHIISAEASLSATEINLQAAQRNYDDALRDYTAGTSPQVLSAGSFLRTARIELDRIEASHTNLRALHAGGIATAEELRQSENALTHARNQENDARISYENAKEFQQRNLEQLRNTLQSASTAYQNARELLNAARIAAQQDVERLRSNVTSAEVSANFEAMEIAIQQLERHLEDSVITAPINGTVTSVIAREGAAGMGLLFTIEDTDKLKIITSFREYDISRIEPGMKVKITTTSNAEYEGTITRISPAASPFSPVVEFEAVVQVNSPDTSLKIGMTTRLTLDLN